MSYPYHESSLFVDAEIATTIAASSANSWRDSNPYWDPGGDHYSDFLCTWDEEVPEETRGAYPAMAVTTHGDGRVVAIGSSNMWCNYHFTVDRTRTEALADSVFPYLLTTMTPE